MITEYGNGQLFFSHGDLYALVYNGLETARVKMLANVELRYCIMGIEDMPHDEDVNKAIITWGSAVELGKLPARSLFLHDRSLWAVMTRYATGIRVRRLTETDMRYREFEPQTMEHNTTVSEADMKI